MKITPPPPVISVIIPMYNAEKFIDTTIQSILNQTFKDFELIIVDDNSTDGSVEIVQSYDDSRIKLIRKFKNVGAMDSFRIALPISQGEYIYFVDHDDALMPTCLETLYNAMESSGADVIHMSSYFTAKDPDFKYGTQCEVEKTVDPNPTPRWLTENLFDRLINEHQDQMSVTYWTKFYRRKIFENGILLSYASSPFPGDIYLTFELLCLVKKFQVIDSCQYVYRQASNSVMRRKADTNIRIILKTLQTAIDFMEKVFASEHLIQPLTDKQKILVTIKHFSTVFDTFILSNMNQFSLKDLHDLFYAVFSTSAMNDSKIETLFMVFYVAVRNNSMHLQNMLERISKRE